MNKEEKINKLKKLKEKFNINKKNKFNMMEVIVLMIITVIFGMFIGGIIMYGKGALNTGIKKELNEFVDTYSEILNEYYDDVSEEGLLEAGINGMISYLGDPYSAYMDSDSSIAFNEKVNGEYVGIGAEIIQYSDTTVEIKNAYENGPAYEAGLRNGDIILSVDSNVIEGKNISEISTLVKGKEGTKVLIKVKRDDEELEFKVTRKKVDIISVNSSIINYQDNKIGYIVVDIFASNTNEQFEKELKKLEKDKIDSLIIDVRSNSGGYLDTVTDIVSLFMKKGELIYQLKTKDKIEKIYDETNEKRDYSIAVLINNISASASELLTATLMENHDAFVVGTKSYGKSKVQKTYELSNGSTLKYTFQEWLTPNGHSIDKIGITPTHEVIYEPALTVDSYDSQITKALELLIKD